MGNRQFLDKTIERIIDGSNPADYPVDWIRVQDFNGDGHIDIVVDDAYRNLIWFNDGTGIFKKTIINLEISPNFTIDENSSHALQVTSLHVDRRAGDFALARSYADFDQDGDIDVFKAPMNQTPFQLYLNDGAGTFTLDANFLNGSPSGEVHPRKALTGDFNSDGKMDIFVIGHGLDQPPFPGDAPYVILSSVNGFVVGTGLENYVGYHHGGASADIDSDGDIDVFLTDQIVYRDRPFFLINDGTGHFTKDTSLLDLVFTHKFGEHNRATEFYA